MRICIILLLLGLASGCVTTTRSSLKTSDLEGEDIVYLKEQVALLKNKIELLEQNYAQLSQEVRRSKESDSSMAALKLRVDELDRKLAALDSARIKEHQALVEQINSKLASMANMLQQVSSSTSSSKTSTTTRPPSSSKRLKTEQQPSSGNEQEGYEHIVQPGETLSAIAAAYKVSVKAIMEANNISKPESLKVGQKLFIPK